MIIGYATTPFSLLVAQNWTLEDPSRGWNSIPLVPLYTDRISNVGFERVKAPRLNDRILVNISNINQDTIVQPRELSRSSKPMFERRSVYFHNSDLQTEWAFGALSNAPFKGDEKVLDFGCEDGKLTALIASLVPRVSATGIDISEKMIGFASKRFPAIGISHIQEGGRFSKKAATPSSASFDSLERRWI